MSYANKLSTCKPTDCSVSGREQTPSMTLEPMSLCYATKVALNVRWPWPSRVRIGRRVVPWSVLRSVPIVESMKHVFIDFTSKKGGKATIAVRAFNDRCAGNPKLLVENVTKHVQRVFMNAERSKQKYSLQSSKPLNKHCKKVWREVKKTNAKQDQETGGAKHTNNKTPSPSTKRRKRTASAIRAAESFIDKARLRVRERNAMVKAIVHSVSRLLGNGRRERPGKKDRVKKSDTVPVKTYNALHIGPNQFVNVPAEPQKKRHALSIYMQVTQAAVRPGL